MLPGKRTPWESRKQSQPVRSGPQPLLNTVTTTAILRPVIRTVMTIYKAHTKANTMVGPKIKVLISHRECPQVLCPRRILGFHIHECTSRSPKSKTHFKKREAHANKNVFASELPRVGAPASGRRWNRQLPRYRRGCGSAALLSRHGFPSALCERG